MKIAIHIFTIYMIALALIPCGDGGGGIVEIANHFFGVEHQEYSDHEEHSNGCGDDFCSPFCVCSCCASVLDYPVKLPLKIKSPTPTQLTSPSFVSNLILSSYSSAVWQPPKFS